MLVEISFSGAKSKSEVLEIIGDSLEFGGPEGNVRFNPDEKIGWGLNWDALSDCLRMLSSGGIWGTSRRFDFPLVFQFMDHGEFKTSSPADFQVLISILESTKEYYLEQDKEFDFRFGADR
jgi:hypothetical protein